MAFEIEWFEVYKESRSTKFTRDNVQKDFTYIIKGNFYEEAETQGMGDSYGLNDDILVIKEVAKKWFSLGLLVPIYDASGTYENPNFPDGLIVVCYLADCSVVQQSDDTWKVTLMYDQPQDGGASAGGGNGNLGPGAGEGPTGTGWSDNFTQLSFDISTTTRIQKFSRSVIACQLKTSDTRDIPYELGKPGPLGLSNEGIQGIEIDEPVFKFSITVFLQPSQLKYRYARRLAQLVTRLNNATFFGFPSGSVRLLGSRARGHLFQTIPLDLDFEWKPNFKFSTTSETLSDPDNDDVDEMFDTYWDGFFPDSTDGEEPGDAISGWSNVEYVYEKVPTADKKIMLQQPYMRIISQICSYGDFSKLNI